MFNNVDPAHRTTFYTGDSVSKSKELKFGVLGGREIAFANDSDKLKLHQSIVGRLFNKTVKLVVKDNKSGEQHTFYVDKKSAQQFIDKNLGSSRLTRSEAEKIQNSRDLMAAKLNIAIDRVQDRAEKALTEKVNNTVEWGHDGQRLEGSKLAENMMKKVIGDNTKLSIGRVDVDAAVATSTIEYIAAHQDLNLERGEVQEMREGMLLKNQAAKIEKELQCGSTTIGAAGILKTNGKYKADKPCQDNVSFNQLTVRIAGEDIKMSFLVGADGNASAGDIAAAYYNQKAPALLTSKLGELHSISDADVQEALKATHEELQSGWAEFVKEKKLQGNCTSNMVLLFPEPNSGKVQGAFLGAGDFRSLVLKKDGEVRRLGRLLDEGLQLSTFSLEKGDKIFMSSDGVWHNTSPNQVNEFLRKRMEGDDLKTKSQEEKTMSALEDLVKIMHQGQPDDLSPCLISIN